jgi:hypothetical protein
LGVRVFYFFDYNYIFFALRNEFSSTGFSSIRNLALRAVALEKAKVSFFRSISLEWVKPYFRKLFLNQSVECFYQ